MPHEAFGEGKEIIEEYDEHVEMEWRRKHADSVRKQKAKERQERQKSQETKEDINKTFDEFEMMEELAEELDNMEIQDDETLKKILSGELKVPESKKRVARVPNPLPSDENLQEDETSCEQPQEINNNSLIAQNNQEIVDLLRNYRLKIKEVLKNVKKDDERNVNLFLDLIELKDDIEDDIRRMNDDDESLESDENDSDDDTLSIQSKPPEISDQKRVRFSKSLEDVKLIESKSDFDGLQYENNTIEIKFQHSDAKFSPKVSESDTITHPGEIPVKFHHVESLVPAKKSILKNKEKDAKLRETMDEKKVKKIFLSDTPVIGDVVEHKKDICSEEIIQVAAKSEVPQKISKFKQMRMKS